MEGGDGGDKIKSGKRVKWMRARGEFNTEDDRKRCDKREKCSMRAVEQIKRGEMWREGRVDLL